MIYCCGCERKVDARLTDGKEIYPNRTDLKGLPFWKCDGCGNYVGCHYKTKNRTNPLGVIPTAEIREARKELHKILDPIWQSGKVERKVVYAQLKKELGYEYHTANIRNMDEFSSVCRVLVNFIQ